MWYFIDKSLSDSLSSWDRDFWKPVLAFKTEALISQSQFPDQDSSTPDGWDWDQDRHLDMKNIQD